MLSAGRKTGKERFVQLNSVSLCTESFGNPAAPAILLMMGATASMLWWEEEFCHSLSGRGFFVIRYDNRDVGRSTTYPPGSTPYGLDEMTDDAIGILEAYGLEQAHLVGMSLGGLIAQIAAIKYPEKVRSLILIATGPFGPTDPTIPDMDERILAFQAKAGEVDWSDEDAVAGYLVSGAALLSGPARPFDWDRAENLARAEFRRAGNYLSMFNHAALQGGEAFYGRSSEITQPALIIHGTADQIWHYNHTQTLMQELVNSQLLTMEGAGHELHRQDWEAVIQAISSHVTTVEKN